MPNCTKHVKAVQGSRGDLKRGMVCSFMDSHTAEAPVLAVTFVVWLSTNRYLIWKTNFLSCIFFVAKVSLSLLIYEYLLIYFLKRIYFLKHLPLDTLFLKKKRPEAKAPFLRRGLCPARLKVVDGCDARMHDYKSISIVLIDFSLITI